MSKPRNVYAITTGDVDGIGLEVSLKALSQLSDKYLKNIFLLLRSNKHSRFYNLQLKFLYKKKFKNHFCVSSLNEALHLAEKFSSSHLKTPLLIEVILATSPALWVEEVALLCQQKRITALITGPLSKTEIHSSGLKDMGHTGILKRVTQTDDLFMCFIGRYFNVLCLTGHIPIKEIANEDIKSKLKNSIQLINSSKLINTNKKKSDKIAVLGLNPHSGEDGLIGDEEQKFIKPVISQFKNTIGPLVPDVAFQKQNWKKYGIYISIYHDQGLIPFKLVHGHNSGVHLTLGLPFIRTSVDHGTAKDIFKKNIANPQSMLDAIKCAIKLSRSEKKNGIR